MSQTTQTKQIHIIKSYKIDKHLPTTFEAPLGNIQGLLNRGVIYVMIDHTKRFTETAEYTTLIVNDGEEFDIYNHQYVGTFVSNDTIKHVYIKAKYKSGDEGLIIIPR